MIDLVQPKTTIAKSKLDELSDYCNGMVAAGTLTNFTSAGFNGQGIGPRAFAFNDAYLTELNRVWFNLWFTFTYRMGDKQVNAATATDSFLLVSRGQPIGTILTGNNKYAHLIDDFKVVSNYRLTNPRIVMPLGLINLSPSLETDGEIRSTGRVTFEIKNPPGHTGQIRMNGFKVYYYSGFDGGVLSDFSVYAHNGISAVKVEDNGSYCAVACTAVIMPGERFYLTIQMNGNYAEQSRIPAEFDVPTPFYGDGLDASVQPIMEYPPVLCKSASHFSRIGSFESDFSGFSYDVEMNAIRQQAGIQDKFYPTSVTVRWDNAPANNQQRSFIIGKSWQAAKTLQSYASVNTGQGADDAARVELKKELKAKTQVEVGRVNHMTDYVAPWPSDSDYSGEVLLDDGSRVSSRASHYRIPTWPVKRYVDGVADDYYFANYGPLLGSQNVFLPHMAWRIYIQRMPRENSNGYYTRPQTADMPRVLVELGCFQGGRFTPVLSQHLEAGEYSATITAANKVIFDDTFVFFRCSENVMVDIMPVLYSQPSGFSQQTIQYPIQAESFNAAVRMIEAIENPFDYQTVTTN